MWIQKAHLQWNTSMSTQDLEVNKHTDWFRAHFEDLESDTLLEIVKDLIDLWWEIVEKLEISKNTVLTKLTDFEYRATLDYSEDNRWFVDASDRTFWYNPIFDEVKKGVSETVNTVNDIINTHVDTILISVKSLQLFMEELVNNETLLFSPTSAQQKKIKHIIENKFTTIKIESILAQEKIANLINNQPKTVWRKERLVDLTASEDMNRLHWAINELTHGMKQEFLTILNESIWAKTPLTFDQCEKNYKRWFGTFL